MLDKIMGTHIFLKYIFIDKSIVHCTSKHVVVVFFGKVHW